MSCYSNPTTNIVIGANEKELHRVRWKAKHIKALKEKGRLTQENLVLARKPFYRY